MRLPAISYRYKLLASSLFLSLFLLAGFFINDFNQRLIYTIVLFVLSLVTHLVSFWPYKKFVGTWFSFIIPFYLISGGLLFEWLLPSSWLVNVIFILVILILLYASFLSTNIFLISARRTIKLFQAALGISLFLVIVAIFLVMDALLAFRLMPWWNFLLTFIIVLPVAIYLIWMVDLSYGMKKKYLYYGLILALLSAEAGLVISFWPTQITIKAIFIASLVYSFGGLFQAHFLEKIFKQTEQEFWWLIVVVFASLFLVTRWGG